MRPHATRATLLLPLLLLQLQGQRGAWAQSCDGGVPEDRREDCHPEPGASPESCAARGCRWCPASAAAPSAPWCFRSDSAGAAGCGAVSDAAKSDCHPEEGAAEGSCLARGCCWAVVAAPGVPWCFHAPGDTCGSDQLVEDAERVDCHPEKGATEAACRARGCRWCPASAAGAPWCFIPRDGSYGYAMRGAPQKTAKGWRVDLQKLHSSSLFGADVEIIALEAEFHTADRLRIKVFDPSQARFEVPLQVPSPDTAAAGPQYEVRFESAPFFHFKVLRRSSGEALWDTSLGGLTFSQQFLQLATRLGAGSSVYGFGEHEHPAYRHHDHFVSHGMYARDQSPTPAGNLYGVHNFYLGVGSDFTAHGVLLLNSNAQDVTLAPGPALTYRTIGGVLDFYFFLGPTPESVVQQYTEAVGRPFLPPYWSLGFQLSRWGYGSLGAVKAAVDRLSQHDIPHDVQYGDIDYMDRQLDFTYDTASYAGLPQYVQSLRDAGMHYVIILDPCITKDEPPGSYRPYELGQQMDIWIKNSDGSPAVGKVWPPGGSVFPDFTNPATASWWVQMCVEFSDVIKYDGIWIDMNEPANFGTGQEPGCANNLLNKPPYHPRISGDDLAEKTLCPDARTHLGLHYDTHSLFGWAQHEPSFHASQNATGKRAFVLSRSTFVGSGRWAGHWLGDNFSLWRDMHMSIIGMLEFNIFGIPYIGADICGFIYDTSYELCLRWMQLGAFYPFSRNHNGLGYKDQDPGVFGPEFAEAARSALLVRYTLLPFLYSLFHEAHTRGGTVVRPLLHEFVTDVQTHGVDRAFLWGPALMVAPVLAEGATTVDVYFPDARWYSYYTGEEVPASWRRSSARVAAPLELIPLFLRGGFVVPTQQPARTTTHSRVNPMGLIVSLDENLEARGSLFWDDGDSIGTVESGNYFLASFVFTGKRLTSRVERAGYAAGLAFQTVRVLGLRSPPGGVTVDGSPLPSSDVAFHPSGELTLKISVPITTPLNIAIN
ncbi:sucrase-isomaltase, intestinal-like [Lethenteron reissneri]|uniref:sucrase-isomaltase, intestinal-like n=1 Tax=Lethenteron reissneri TaxID=7753 RepID=UPI002AB769D5|nr:sucrase-isomaltase, intestinal-like [Lethenteron reissneri]